MISKQNPEHLGGSLAPVLIVFCKLYISLCGAIRFHGVVCLLSCAIGTVYDDDDNDDDDGGGDDDDDEDEDDDDDNDGGER